MENQFELMPQRSRKEAIYLLRRFSRGGKKELLIDFVDISPREIMWWILEKTG